MKNINIILLIAIIAIGIVSCEKKESKNSSIDEKQMRIANIAPEDFDYVGAEHNAGLDYIYNRLKNEVVFDESLTLGDFLAYIDDFSSDFFYLSDEIPAEFIELEGIQEMLDRCLYSSYKSNFVDSVISNEQLSTDQQELLEELMTGVDASSTLQEIHDLVTNINSDASTLIANEEELAVIYAATSVIMASCEYWYYNSNKWCNLYSTNAKEPWFSWGSVSKSDGAGAVGGAASGAMFGLMAGGIGALPGAGAGACAGAVCASVGDAAGQLINHWFFEEDK